MPAKQPDYEPIPLELLERFAARLSEVAPARVSIRRSVNGRIVRIWTETRAGAAQELRCPFPVKYDLRAILMMMMSGIQDLLWNSERRIWPAAASEKQVEPEVVVQGDLVRASYGPPEHPVLLVEISR